MFLKLEKEEMLPNLFYGANYDPATKSAENTPVKMEHCTVGLWYQDKTAFIIILHH